MVIPTPTVGYDQVRLPRSLAGLAGCGGCYEFDDSGNCISQDMTTCDSGSGFTTGTTPPSSITWDPGFITGTIPPASVNPSGTPVAPSSVSSTGMTAAQLSLYNTILKNAGTIGMELALQPGVSVSPTGAVSQQNPGYPVVGTPLGTALGLTGSSSSTMLLLLVGVVAVMFMSKR